MERFCKVAILFILAPALALGQWQIGQRSFYHTSAAPSAQVFNAFCVQAGTNTSYTTAAIDTTGATAIAITISGAAGISPTVSDNKGNGNATALTRYGTGPNVQIYYYANPVVGTGHTFTIAGTNNYTTVCVAPMKGITGLNDSTDAGNAIASTTTCAATASINPGSGTHIVIAALAYNSNYLSSIDSGYTIQGRSDGSAGVAEGGSVASLVQNPGASTNPTWTMTTAADAACALTSFH